MKKYIFLSVSAKEVHYQNSLLSVQHVISEMNPDLIILDVMVGDDNSLEHIRINIDTIRKEGFVLSYQELCF